MVTFGRASRLRLLTLDQALLQPRENVLDVGCGTGGVTIPAKIRVGENGSAAGIDPAPEMIAVARRKAKRGGGGRVFVADMRRPSTAFLKRFFTSLVLHHGHGVQFGIEDLPKLMREAGFEKVEQLDARFLTIGFVRAKKPAA